MSVKEVGEWIQQGRANGDTRVQAEGDSEWISIRDVPELEPFLGPDSTQPAGDEPLPPALDAVPTADQIMVELEGRPQTFAVRDCLRNGWQLFRANLGLFLLGTICFMGLNMVAGIVPFGGLIVAGPLMGGFYLIFIKRLRGETAAIGNLFSGFGSFLNLFLVYLLISIIMIVPAIPHILTWIIGAIVITVQAASRPEINEVITTGTTVGMFLSVTLIPVFFVYGILVFTFPLTIDRRVNCIDAISVVWSVTKNCWGKCFWLSILPWLFSVIFLVMPGVIGIVYGAYNQSISVIVGSVIALLLGILVILLVIVPFVIAANTVAYDQLFGGGEKQP